MAGKVFYITFVISIVWVAMAQEIHPKLLANVDGCYIKEINEVIPFGSAITPPGQCFRVDCGNRVLNYTLCGGAKIDNPNCRVIGIDLNKSFPDCCPYIECVSKTLVE